MNFNSLINKVEILEEARAGRFDKLFNTGYLKKAIEDKKIGVARPIVFEFIINFLKDKGMVPEGTAFAGSRYAAEAGEFIKNLVDSGVIKDEIADEFKQYMNKELSRFLQIKQQVRSRGKGENIGKSFGSKEEFEQFGKVKTPEEMAAEKQAKKSGQDTLDPENVQRGEEAVYDKMEDAMGDEDVWQSDLVEKIEDNIIKWIEGVEKKVKEPKDMVGIRKLRSFLISNLGQANSYIEFKDLLDSQQTPFGKTDEKGTILFKIWRNYVEPVLMQTIAASVVDINRAPASRARETRSGVDVGGSKILTGGRETGYGSEEALSNPLDENEEEIVKESKKPVVKFIANKDIKAKTYWQKMAQQELYYR